MFLIVTALEHEARGLRKVLGHGSGGATTSEARLAVLGVMGQRAAQAADSLLKGERPEALISLGFAGALDDTLKEGDLVLGSRTVFRDREGDFSSWASSDEGLLERAKEALEGANIPYHVGDIVTTWRVVGDPAEKGRLGVSTNGLTVDMESSWIAGVAEKAGVPVLLVRAVLDRTSLNVPRTILGAASRPAWFQWLWVGLTSLLSPRNVPALLELRRCSDIAEESLAGFLRAFLGAGEREAAVHGDD